MFCPECGKENANDNIFCEECGTKFDENTINQSKSLQNTTNITQEGRVVSNTKKNPIPLKTKRLAGGVVLAAALIYANYKTAEKVTSPETVAENYFVSLVNGDLETAYDYLQLPEDPFLTKENYLKMDDKILNASIANYKSGEESDYLSSEEQGITKSINISYTTGVTSGENSFQVDMVKTMDKKYLLFDDWMVNPVNNLTTDYSISVPVGATVTLDGGALDTYLTETANGHSRYEIPYLFTGEHVIKVTQDGMVEVEETVVTSSGYSEQFYLATMEMQEVVKQELFNKSIELLQTTFETVFERGEFEQIKPQFSSSVSDFTEFEKMYDSLRDRVKDEEGMGLTSIEFNGMNGQISSYTEDKKLYADVYLDAKYSYESKRKSWFGTSIYEDEGTGNYSETYTYCYNEGNWELVYVNFSSIYY